MKLSEEEALALKYNWRFWARPEQVLPDWAWYVWLLLSGRGGGKTRTGSESVIEWAEQGFSPIALVGQTKADVRDVMIELGDSSILKCSRPDFMPEYNPTKRRLTWPNGVIGITYSGDEPDQLRGPQHAKAWVDELAKYQRPVEIWDNLMMGLRMGANPQVIVSTTPRPISIIKKLVAQADTHVTRTHTLANRENLAPQFLNYVLEKYEGTRLGRQELNAEILSDNPDALWKRDEIDNDRVFEHPDLYRIVVGVDPEATKTEDSAETGIITAGISNQKKPEHAYVLSDDSIRGTPKEWGTAAITAYHKFKADVLVAEVNNGGDMVEAVIHNIDPNVNVKKVHASKGKYTRAEPISAIYEQNRVHHVGVFPELEDQCCEWVPGEKSPDRLDALVWCISELITVGPNHTQIG